jgi:hypothetical protein
MRTMTPATDSLNPSRAHDAEPREVETNPAPQHLGTYNRCSHTYLLGTFCGTAEHTR